MDEKGGTSRHKEKGNWFGEKRAPADEKPEKKGVVISILQWTQTSSDRRGGGSKLEDKKGASIKPRSSQCAFGRVSR